VIVANGSPEAVAAAVDATNARLPEYAQVRRWLVADASFGPGNGLATANGRPRRSAIWARYQFEIQALYEDTPWTDTNDSSRQPLKSETN
jgi:hypothetical protein